MGPNENEVRMNFETIIEYRGDTTYFRVDSRNIPREGPGNVLFGPTSGYGSIEGHYPKLPYGPRGYPVKGVNPTEIGYRVPSLACHAAALSIPPSDRYRCHSGVPLPRVPVEQGWKLHEYLDKIFHKVGFPYGPYSEKGALRYTFTAIVFSGGE